GIDMLFHRNASGSRDRTGRSARSRMCHKHAAASTAARAKNRSACEQVEPSSPRLRLPASGDCFPHLVWPGVASGVLVGHGRRGHELRPHTLTAVMDGGCGLCHLRPGTSVKTLNEEDKTKPNESDYDPFLGQPW